MMQVGIDQVEVSRIRELIETTRFLEKYFGEEERKLFTGAHAAERAAANFAAKEAFAKALRTGVRGFSLNEVQILRDELGAPYLLLSGNAKRMAEDKKLRFSCSLTHTKEYAAAIVLAEEEK